MTISVARRSARTGRYRTTQMYRRELVQRGIDKWRVTATSDDRLYELEMELENRQLRLVPPFEVQDAAPEMMPRLGVRLSREQQMASEGFSPDEIASVQTAMRGTLVEPDFASVDQADPWDFDGGSAA
jgi:SOS response regulatory protein OraA/RecX